MSKTRQVMKLCDNGNKYIVVYHESDHNNPYWLYKLTHEPNKYGYMTEHKKLIVKYADMVSCLYYLAQNF